MNTRLVNAAADLICRTMQTHRTPAGIAAALDAAGMLQSPENADTLEQLRASVAELESTAGRRRIAWQRARTRARAAGGAADRCAAQAAELLMALQDTVGALLAGQLERDGLRARVAELETAEPRFVATWCGHRNAPTTDYAAAWAEADAAHQRGERDASVVHYGQTSREWVAAAPQHATYDSDRAGRPTRGAEVSPWQRAVDGLNALATAGIGFHIEPDGHISNPSGDEHIEWDRTAERWVLIHDDADAEPHPELCRWPASPDCACPSRPTAAESSDKLRGSLAPSVLSAPPEPNGCAQCGIPQRGHAIQVTAHGHHRWTAPTDEQIKARMKSRRAERIATRGDRP